MGLPLLRGSEMELLGQTLFSFLFTCWAGLG